MIATLDSDGDREGEKENIERQAEIWKERETERHRITIRMCLN